MRTIVLLAAVLTLVVGAVVVWSTLKRWKEDDARFARLAAEARAAQANANAAPAVAPAPPVPKAAPAGEGPSCDDRGMGGTCTEYPGKSEAPDARTRCTNGLGKWSLNPCPREGAFGVCVVGSQLDHGASIVIYPSRFTRKADAPAMCSRGFDGAFTPL